MEFYVFFGFFFIIPLVICQRNPIITSITHNFIADVNEDVSLSCSVQYQREYPVMWVKKIKGKDLMLSSNKNVLFPNQHYSLDSDEGSNTYTLQINGIKQTDDGIYECRIPISVTADISSQVRLSVRIQPTISDNSTRSVLKSEGADVELFCHASGFPTPKITWRRENNKVLPSGGAIYRGNKLMIHNIHKKDRGVYYCVADNGIGIGARRDIRVDVEFAPVISVTMQKYEQALTYDVYLQCQVEAFPAPSIEWVKENTILVNDNHFRISNFANEEQKTATSIQVVSIQKSQYGDYSCRAINKLGSSEKNIELLESVVPICPPACDVGIISSANLKQVSLQLLLSLIGMQVLLKQLFNSAR